MKLIGLNDQANNLTSTAKDSETLHLMSKKWLKNIGYSRDSWLNAGRSGKLFSKEPWEREMQNCSGCVTSPGVDVQQITLEL